ncbi:MAG TPA: SpoIIE family protein phosphatase [Candidatus Rifleibacterium sp.]|nr:SpoIIE family protein phosphatase [Candidatus Rifleibacterium sp.]HPT45800.1 SpoIIE family protein phosphatase [Candidatus Rifleibacterium sp.]
MDFSAFLGVTSAMIQAGLAVLVLVKNTSRRENRLFSLLLLLFMFWSLGELYLIHTSISATGVKLLFTPGILLAYFFCVFTAIYPEYQADALIFRDRWRPLLIFLPATLLLALLWSNRLVSNFEAAPGGFSLTFGSFEFVLKGIIVGYLFLSLTTLSNSRQKAESTAQMRRLRYTFTAMLLPVAAGSIIIALSRWFTGGMTMYPFGLFPVLGIIMSIILSYTMLRYNLMEIDLIFSIGLVYTLLTAILAGFMELMQELMQAILNFSDVWSRIFSILLISAVFSPLKEILVNLVNRFFGRQAFDSAKVMQAILTELRKQPDRARLFARFVSELQLILDFSSGVVLAANPDSGEEAAVAFPELPAELNDIDAIMHFYGGTGNETLLQTAKALKAKDYRHYFAFCSDEEFYGCLLLGPKSTKVPYTETELNLVQGLTHEIPHIIENLQMINRLLTQEKAAREIELAAGMLRAISANPGPQTFAGFKIAAFSSLAGEIKGDMLDICEDEGNQFLGLYDAFHHGIQAVLTLNLLFSVFRSVNDADAKLLTVSRLLQHFANPQLCSAITLVTANDQGLRIRNCGNPSPLLISNGQVTRLLEENSEPVGLGVQTQASVCDIMPGVGDLVFISTNGLFKAFKELRGRDLADYLASASMSGVEECHRLVSEEIAPFIRKRYSDDITFIVAGLK